MKSSIEKGNEVSVTANHLRHYQSIETNDTISRLSKAPIMKRIAIKSHVGVGKIS